MTAANEPDRRGGQASRTGGHARAGFWTLALGSVGVVYGDIGTSPLYAFKEALGAATGHGPVSHEMVLGVLSLILWALIVIVTVKYVLIIMRMDNHGEGGTLSLMALVQRALGPAAGAIGLLGIAGAALFYGDAIITPAISVLSAVEGLELVEPELGSYVIPASLVIIVVLFAAQNLGTGRVAAWFGPITLVWFAVLAAGGAVHVVQAPAVLWAIDPSHGVRFLATHGTAGLVALGAVFLAVTGAEALYADMGHFGASPIRLAWLCLVFPALAINYLGQGALLLTTPEALDNPFFLLYPGWALLPVVLLATVATVIASQAVITGAFSLTQQAIQLGLLPRMRILRTSETEAGQIYLPRVNWLLMTAVLFLIVMFRSSSSLASAYGIAVTATMVITAIMAFVVMWKCWHWPPALAALVIVPLGLIDLVFLGANLLKVAQGGWLPLLVAAMLVTAMVTWRRGVRILTEKAVRSEMALTSFLATMKGSALFRVPGTAVFPTGSPDTTPSALLHNLRHNKVLHERNIVLSVVAENLPKVEDERVVVEEVALGFVRVVVRFGFMETPDVPAALAAHGLRLDMMKTSYFLSRRTLKLATPALMPRWQERIFITLAQGADDASRYFCMPATRVVEVGTQITI